MIAKDNKIRYNEYITQIEYPWPVELGNSVAEIEQFRRTDCVNLSIMLSGEH